MLLFIYNFSLFVQLSICYFIKSFLFALMHDFERLLRHFVNKCSSRKVISNIKTKELKKFVFTFYIL